MYNIAQALNNAGLGVLRFDFTGLGESGGNFSETSFSTNVEDLISASQFLATEYKAPSLLLGQSWGGTAVLHAAGKIKSTKAVVTIAAPYDPAQVMHHFKNKQNELQQSGEACVSIGGREFLIKQQFLDDLKNEGPKDRIRNLNKPLLVFHSPQDVVVPIEEGLKIFQAARQPKSFIALEGGDHLLSRRQDGRYVGETVAQWSDRYL